MMRAKAGPVPNYPVDLCPPLKNPIWNGAGALVFMLSVLFVVRAPSSFAGATAKPKPPEQPSSGPGGKEYRHAAVKKIVYGEGATQYWIFEPAGPAPASAPLIVFNHGWGAVNPKAYGAWIEHLVRRGNIVIYPRYQANRRTPTRDFAPNAIQAVKEAIRTLQGEGHVKPELEKFAIVGHSAGGQTTANMAALAVSSGLPEPKAVMSVQPGKSWNISERIQIPLENLSSIPSKTLLLAVVGDKDRIARDVDAKRIFNETPQIPKANKNYVILVSDDHGEPPLIANHFCPVAVDDRYDSGESTEKRPGLLTRLREALRPKKAKGRDEEAERGAQGEDEDVSTVKDGSRTLNALDYYGLWKLFDGLCDAAFYGKNREYALGNTPQQRFMGKWSDGLPVKELLVLDSP